MSLQFALFHNNKRVSPIARSYYTVSISNGVETYPVYVLLFDNSQKAYLNGKKILEADEIQPLAEGTSAPFFWLLKNKKWSLFHISGVCLDISHIIGADFTYPEEVLELLSLNGLISLLEKKQRSELLCFHFENLKEVDVKVRQKNLPWFNDVDLLESSRTKFYVFSEAQSRFYVTEAEKPKILLEATYYPFSSFVHLSDKLEVCPFALGEKGLVLIDILLNHNMKKVEALDLKHLGLDFNLFLDKIFTDTRPDLKLINKIEKLIISKSIKSIKRRI